MGRFVTLRERYELQRFSRLLNSRYGISRPVQVATIRGSDPHVFLVKFRQVDFGVYGGYNSFAAGCSTDLKQALVSACGEAIERYGGFLPPRAESRMGSYRELSTDVILLEPNTYQMFTPEQRTEPGFSLAEFNAETRLSWIAMNEAATGERVFIPLDLLGHYGASDLPRIESPTSSGLAAGPNKETALQSACLELIERDAVMRAWWLKKSPLRLEWRDLLHEEEFRGFTPMATETEVVTLPSPTGVPAVLAAFRGKNCEGSPGLIVGAAAHPCEKTAVRKALTEVAHLVLRSRASFNSRMSHRPPDEPNQVRSFLDHVLYYFPDTHIAKAEFLWSARASRPVSTLDSATSPIERLLAQGKKVYWVDLSPTDVASLGFAIVRAFIPSLIPMNSDHRYRPWGHPDLRGIKLNPWPHPFS